MMKNARLRPLPVLIATAMVATPALAQETIAMGHARGIFEVTITQVQPPEGTPPDAPGRMALSKVFHGDFEGTGAGEMLATMAPNQSGAYAAMERLVGSLGGRRGSFAMIHRGIMDKGAQELLITVVPGSGTGELEGIAGVFDLTIEGGEHRYDLEYSLPSP